MKTIEIVLTSVFILVALFAAVTFMVSRPVSVGAAGYQVTNIGLTSTSTRLVAVTSSVRLSATTTSPTDSTTSYVRSYVNICNANVNPVYLRFDGDKPASIAGGYTAVIAAAAGYNVCYEINDRNLYLGSIQASSTNQTSTNVSIAEYIQ